MSWPLKHGYAGTKIYDVCAKIRQRCLNKNDKFYYRYGGRGILLHEPWQESYKEMIEYMISIGYRDGLVIDRIDNEGHYEPGNLRFTTHAHNARNRSTTILTEGDVHDIRFMLLKGELGQGAIGRLFNVSNSTISNIKTGRKWRKI